MKKIIIVLMIAMMVSMFTACGESHDNRIKIADGPFGGLFGGGVYVTHQEVKIG